MTTWKRLAIGWLAPFGIVLAALATLTGTTVAMTPAEARVPSDAAIVAAPRVTGLVTVHADSRSDSGAPSVAVAVCPPGKQVLGGGGAVDGPRRILTQMRPYGPSGGRYAYSVTAAAIAPNTGGWGVHAWAFCADPVPGYHIVSQSTEWLSPPVQERAAPCPAGQRVLGMGGRITPLHAVDDHRRIGLQMVRAFGPGSNGVQAAVVQASELPGGYAYDWQLTAFAVCADTPEGYKVNAAVSELHDSYPGKVAAVGCPSRRWVNVSGAVDTPASGWGAPGNITLYALGWALDNGTLTAHAEENTTTPVDWVLEVQTICVE